MSLQDSLTIFWQFAKFPRQAWKDSSDCVIWKAKGWYMFHDYIYFGMSAEHMCQIRCRTFDVHMLQIALGIDFVLKHKYCFIAIRPAQEKFQWPRRVSRGGGGGRPKILPKTWGIFGLTLSPPPQKPIWALEISFLHV